jgi:simple sugar transport system permease protein
MADTATRPVDQASPPEEGSALTLTGRVLRSPALAPGVVVIAVYLFFAIVAGGNGFLSVASTASWLDTTAQLGIVAVPISLLMIAGEFDLSVGSVVGAGSITMGVAIEHYNLPLIVAAMVGVAIGIVVGLVNGVLVTRTGLPSFIVTLGANLIVLGLGISISDGLLQATTVSFTVNGGLANILDYSVDGFDISIVWWLASALVAGWILIRSRFGSWILATGGDAAKARRSGVMTSRIKLLLFVWAAGAAAFLGVLEAVQYTTGDPTTGSSYVFEAPIVAVIGGTLLTGGYGNVLGTVFGVLIYGITSAGLFYTGWDTNLTQVFLGILMLLAVLANHQLLRLALLPLRRGERKRQ